MAEWLPIADAPNNRHVLAGAWIPGEIAPVWFVWQYWHTNNAGCHAATHFLPLSFLPPPPPAPPRKG